MQCKLTNRFDAGQHWYFSALANVLQYCSVTPAVLDFTMYKCMLPIQTCTPGLRNGFFVPLLDL